MVEAQVVVSSSQLECGAQQWGGGKLPLLLSFQGRDRKIDKKRLQIPGFRIPCKTSWTIQKRRSDPLTTR
jgi:hypothetical protein